MRITRIKPSKFDIQKNKEFYTLKGYLTSYALSCGYIDRWESGKMIPYYVCICNPPFISIRPTIEFRLFKENCIYIVSCRYGEEFKNTSFNTLLEARKFVSILVQEYKRLDNV